MVSVAMVKIILIFYHEDDGILEEIYLLNTDGLVKHVLRFKKSVNSLLLTTTQTAFLIDVKTRLFIKPWLYFWAIDIYQVISFCRLKKYLV